MPDPAVKACVTTQTGIRALGKLRGENPDGLLQTKKRKGAQYLYETPYDRPGVIRGPLP